MVNNGANIHAEKDYSLRWASQCGHLKTVKFLAKYGANVNAKNNEALRWARKNDYKDVVEFLESFIK